MVWLPLELRRRGGYLRGVSRLRPGVDVCWVEPVDPKWVDPSVDGAGRENAWCLVDEMVADGCWTRPDGAWIPDGKACLLGGGKTRLVSMLGGIEQVVWVSEDMEEVLGNPDSIGGGACGPWKAAREAGLTLPLMGGVGGEALDLKL